MESIATMPVQVLIVRYKFNMPQAEYEDMAFHLAGAILDVHGLRWKIWLINPAACEAGGIYLFDDERATQAFLAGPILAAIKNHPAFSHLTIRRLTVLEATTEMTHGPIQHGAPV